MLSIIQQTLKIVLTEERSETEFPVRHDHILLVGLALVQ